MPASRALLSLSQSVNAVLALTALANVFSSHQVLQRDTPNPIWGFADPGVVVTLVNFDGGLNISAAAGPDTVWRLVLPAVPVRSLPTTLAFASSDGGSFAMTDVLFGDVFLCSGQSNMGLPVGVLWNVTDVVSAAAPYTLVRLFTAPVSANSSTPLPSFPTDGLRPWQVPLPNGTASNATLLGFSAACYIFGTTLHDGTDGAVPVGLLQSARGGSSILTWQSPAAVDVCGDLPADGWNRSVLFNSNIHPLTLGPLSLKAAVWYQGEEDVGLGSTESYTRAAWYNCALPALIADWRAVLGNPTLPFVVQQLHAWIHDVNVSGVSPGDFGLALFRALQQQVVARIPGVAMSVAFDGGDPAAVMSPPGSPSYSPSGTVHPHCKFIPGRRIAAAMAGVLQQQPQALYPTYASAVATSYTTPDGHASNITVVVSFTLGSTGGGLQTVPYDAASNSSHCPTERGVNTTYCDWFGVQVNDAYPVGTWLNASTAVGADRHTLVLHVQAPGPGLVAVATRNGWSDWPVTTVYTVDGQPVLPWKKSVVDP